MWSCAILNKKRKKVLEIRPLEALPQSSIGGNKRSSRLTVVIIPYLRATSQSFFCEKELIINDGKGKKVFFWSK